MREVISNRRRRRRRRRIGKPPGEVRSRVGGGRRRRRRVDRLHTERRCWDEGIPTHLSGHVRLTAVPDLLIMSPLTPASAASLVPVYRRIVSPRTRVCVVVVVVLVLSRRARIARVKYNSDNNNNGHSRRTGGKGGIILIIVLHTHARGPFQAIFHIRKLLLCFTHDTPIFSARRRRRRRRSPGKVNDRINYRVVVTFIPTYLILGPSSLIGFDV